MEHVRGGVGRFPLARQVRNDVESLIVADEAVEDQAVDVFGDRIGPDARIEIGRRLLDQEIYGVRFGRTCRPRASTGEGDAKSKNANCDKAATARRAAHGCVGARRASSRASAGLILYSASIQNQYRRSVKERNRLRP